MYANLKLFYMDKPLWGFLLINFSEAFFKTISSILIFGNNIVENFEHIGTEKLNIFKHLEKIKTWKGSESDEV